MQPCGIQVRQLLQDSFKTQRHTLKALFQTKLRTSGKADSFLARKLPILFIAMTALMIWLTSIGKNDMGKRRRLNKDNAVYLQVMKANRHGLLMTKSMIYDGEGWNRGNWNFVSLVLNKVSEFDSISHLRLIVFHI